MYTVDRDNKLCVTDSIAGTKNWGETKQLATVIPQSSVVAVMVSASLPRVRVYTQVAPGQIAEWGTDDGRNYSLMRAQLPGMVPSVGMYLQVR